MGEQVSFKSNGGTCEGYLAGSSGPGVIVIQEWWGLVPHIKDVVDRFAAEGFTALAPDLYHGHASTEPDQAGKLMMALNLEQAAKDLSGAVDYLTARTDESKVGVVGFCMGGGLTLVLACQRPDAVAAAAPFYGIIPWAEVQPNWENLSAKVEGHFAGNDSFFTAAKVHELETTLRGLGKDATLHVYPNTEHAFFNNDRPEVYNAEVSAIAWQRTLDLFHNTL